METIHILGLIGSELMSRPLARDLLAYVRNTAATEVCLDFSGVEFATHSFMDEFYVAFFKSSYASPKVTVKNMSPALDRMLQAVKATNQPRGEKVVLGNAEVFHATSADEMDRFFARFAI